jgi:hypothetical protein
VMYLPRRNRVLADDAADNSDLFSSPKSQVPSLRFEAWDLAFPGRGNLRLQT